METIKGKYILIAGATGGIGSEAARLLAASGAHLFLTGRNASKLAEVAVSCKLDGNAFHACDLSKPGEIAGLKEKYFVAYPAIDTLINTAGIGVIKTTDQLSEEEFLTTLMTNLYAPYALLRAFLPAMKEQKKGLVIQVPGVLGKVPMAGAAAYSASKYGLVGMMQSIREELKRTEIRFTNLFLGGVDSTFWDHIDLRVQRDKMITAAEAAKTIWYLCQQPQSGVISELVLQPFNHQAI
jgi:short-subunit dehydrogenase